MPRGRKPKPTYLRVLQGNRENRPLNKYEPKPPEYSPLEPPEILTAEARAEWQRVAEETYNLGLLTIVDVQVLAAYCQSYGRWVMAERMLAKIATLDPQSNGLLIKNANGNAMVNPLVFVSINAARDMVRYAAEFGFTPAARTRIAVEQSGKESSKFSGLFG
jgi:P27 family predicted phage terminase small subunit